MEKYYYIIVGEDWNTRLCHLIEKKTKIYKSYKKAQKRIKTMTEFYKTITKTKEDIKILEQKDNLQIYFKKNNMPMMRHYYIIRKKFEEYNETL